MHPCFICALYASLQGSCFCEHVHVQSQWPSRLDVSDQQGPKLHLQSNVETAYADFQLLCMSFKGQAGAPTGKATGKVPLTSTGAHPDDIQMDFTHETAVCACCLGTSAANLKCTGFIRGLLPLCTADLWKEYAQSVAGTPSGKATTLTSEPSGSQYSVSQTSPARFIVIWTGQE